MTNQTLICGLALIVIGIFGYVKGQEHVDAEFKDEMVKWEDTKVDNPTAPAPVKKNVNTALIPAAFGGLLILCAVGVIVKPDLRKHIMHAAAVIGILGIVGGFVPMIMSLNKGEDFNLTKPSIRNGLLMALISAIFVYFCVASFIEARKARQAAGK